ncbi:MAG: 23S rRNA (pseudouridine(1915)-N(3))-methyltransferase RlmH [Hyphomonadaceae bacterium]|jgi:23S rRNA (pseudouridine1915-N3)-methyltransferase|nr:23S rRNA (pseudouridine(1915)-N(3))-methyltransferase RlmH [Hyphomonadaceae bacterium]
MILTLAAIGRLPDDAPEQLMARNWLLRAAQTGRPLGFKDARLVEVDPKLRTPDRDREAEALMRALGPDTHCLVLDEHGTDPGSQGFATLLGGLKDRGVRETAVLIGGADGHGEAVRRAGARSLAFGRWTWPHRLVRAMAAEQLYRAVTILAGTPYHRV